MMILKTEAIVLKSFDFRETSRIATFLTRDFGKVKGVLKGIRKDPKKFATNLDRSSVNDIVYYQSRHSDLHVVSHCDMKDFFPLVCKGMECMIAASYGCELLDALIVADAPNEEIYSLTKNFFKSLQQAKDVSKLVQIFQIKILSLSGFQPHLETCVRCGKMVIKSPRFSLRLGGLLCPLCKDTAGEARPISLGAVASILHIQKNGWEDALRLGLAPLVKKELKHMLHHFLAFHLEYQLSSTKFLS